MISKEPRDSPVEDPNGGDSRARPGPQILLVEGTILAIVGLGAQLMGALTADHGWLTRER